MATVREHTSKRGETSYNVTFRHGSKQSSKTFRDIKSAENFRDRLKLDGPDIALKWLADQASVVRTGTLDQLIEKWEPVTEARVTPQVMVDYRRDIRDWISPWFGHVETGAIDEIAVQKWVDHMIAAGCSARMIAGRHALLHQFFKWGSAKTRGHVAHNPCTETVLPKRPKTTPKGLKIAELVLLLDAVNQIEDPMERGQLQDAADLAAFLAGTGWRISEAIALLKDGVELVPLHRDDGSIEIAVYVTMERIRRRRVGEIEDAKSEAGYGRRLRVLGPGAQVVIDRMAHLSSGDHVFTFQDSRGGNRARKPWNVNSFRDRRFPLLVKAAGLESRKPTPHWLRHTHVAICVRLKLSLAEIQRRLGHEDIQTTINIYGRMIEEMTADIAAEADVLMRPTALVIEGGPTAALTPSEALAEAIKSGQLSALDIANALALAASTPPTAIGS